MKAFRAATTDGSSNDELLSIASGPVLDDMSDGETLTVGYTKDKSVMEY